MADKDPIKRRKLYEYLSSEGMTDLSFDDFSVKYATDNKRQAKLFTYLSNNEMTPLNPDEFSREYFGDVKKKEDSVSQPSQESFSTLKPSQALTTSGTESQAITEPLDSSVLETYKRFKESTTVTDEDLAGIDEEIKSRTQTENIDVGFFEGLKTSYDLAKEQIEADYPVLNNFFPDVDTPFNYLREETEKAQEILKEKYKENLPENFSKEVEKLAIELKKEKKKSEIISRKRREFMNELPTEEAEKLEDYGGNALIRENKKISSLVSSKNLFEKTIQEDFDRIKESVEEIQAENEPLEYKIQNTENEAERQALKQQYQANQQRLEQIEQEASDRGYILEAKENGFSISLSDDIMTEYETVVDEIMESEDNLGTIEQEIDLFSRSHNAFTTGAARLGSATTNIVRGLFDMQLMFDEQIAKPIVGKIPFANAALTLRTKAYNDISERIGKVSSKIDDSVQERFTFSEADSFDDFFTYTVGTVGEMMPYVGLAATGVGAGTALIGSSSSGNKYREMKTEMLEGAEYNSWQLLGGSVFAGTSEAALGFLPTARILKNSARVSRAIDNGTKTRSFLGTTKRVLGATSTEGLTEGATQVLMNFDDKFILGKDNVGILDNVQDATIAGAIGGGFLPSFGAVGGSVIKPALQGVERKIISRNVEKIVDIERQMMTNRMSDETVGVLKKTYQKLIDKNKETLDKGIERYKKMSVKEFNVVKNAEKEVSLLKQTAQKIIRNPELSNSIKKEQLLELKAQAKKRLSDKENILKDLDKRSVEETPSETFDKVDSNYNVGDVVNTAEFNNVPAIFKDKRLTIQDKSDGRISMTTEEGNSFVIKKVKDAVQKSETKEVDVQEQATVSEEVGEQVRDGEVIEEEVTYVEDKQGDDIVYSKLQEDRATVVDVSDIPTEAPVIKKKDLKDNQSRVYNDAQKRMFEAKKAEEVSVKNMSKKQSETLKKVRKNPSKTLIPDNGNLEKSLLLDIEQLSPDEAEAYNSYMEQITSEDFNQLNSKKEIEKFAEIYENENVSEIELPEQKTKKPLDAELKSEIENAIKDYSFKNVKLEDIDDVNTLTSLTDVEMNTLSRRDAIEVVRALSYLSEGVFMSPRAKGIVMRINARRNDDLGVEALEGREFKTLLRDKLSKKISEIQKGGITLDKKLKLIENYLNESPLGDIDLILKGKKGDDIFQAFGFSKNATAYSRFESKSKGNFIKGIDNLASKLGKEGSDIRYRSDARILLTQLSESYQKNKPRTKGIFHPEDYIVKMQQEAFKKTDADNSEINRSDVAKDLVVIKEVWAELPKRDDGTVDVEKALENNFNKFEKELYNITNEYNNGEGSDVARRIASIEGERPIIYDHYTPLHVRKSRKVDLGEMVNQAKSFSSGQRGGYKPKFGAVQERLPKVPLIDFNYSENFMKNYKASYKSLYMRPALIENAKTFDRLLNDTELLGEDQRIFVKATQKIMEQITSSTFISEQYLGDSWQAHVASALKQFGYYQELSSTSRAGIELLSNFAHASIYKPKEFGRGLSVTNSSNFSREDFVFALEFSGSTQTSRLVHNSQSARQELGLNVTSKGFGKKINDFNNSILEKPDKWVAFPFWVGNMDIEFEKSTGKRLQWDKIRTDPEYAKKFRDVIIEARKLSDPRLEQGFSTFNPYTGIPSANLASSQTRFRLLKQFDAFMTRFQKSEFASLVKSYEGLRGLNTQSKKEAGALMAATILRMSLYQATRVFVQDYLINSAAGALGYEEEEKQDIGQILKTQAISSVVNALVMRRLGNFAKVGMSTGVESLNVAYGADIGIRSDAENWGYDNALTYSIWRRDDEGNLKFGKFDTYQGLLKILGPYSRLVNSGINSLDAAAKAGYLGRVSSAKSLKTQDKYERRFKEEFSEFLLGTMPVPVPRDMRMVIGYLTSKRGGQRNAVKMKNITKYIEENFGKVPNNKGFIRPAGEQDKLFMDSEEAGKLFEN